MLNYDHPKCVVAVCGTGGHGKSTFFKKLLDRQKAKFWFYYDHKSEMSRRWGLAPCFDLAGLVAQANAGRVCFDPSRMFPGKKGEGFLFFCDFVYQVCEAAKGRKILVCDELQMMVGQTKPEELIAIMDDGRSREIDCFFIVQSVNQIHNNIQNQFTEIFAFRQAHEAATKHLVNVGFEEEQLITLRPGEWAYKNLTSGEVQSGGKAFKIKSSAKYNF